MFTNIRALQTLTVRAITQSADGCIWFAAGKTLYSFDGRQIRPIPSQQLDACGAIGCMYMPDDAHLLIGCERGLVEYDRRHDTFSMIEALAGCSVRAILQLGSDEWIGTSRGLYRNRHNIRHDLDVISLINSEGSMLVSCMNRMVEYDVERGTFFTLTLPHPGFATCFARGPRGQILAGSINCVYAYDTGHKRFHPAYEAFPVTKCLLTDTHGNLMVGCDGGLYQIDANGCIHPITHDARNPRSLGGNAVWCMMRDRQGNVWIGTDNGLSVLSGSQDFCIYPLSSITHSGRGNQVYCTMYDSHQRLWLGGSNGIVKIADFDTTTQSCTWYAMNDTLHSIPHNRIRHFYEDPVWGIWACTDGGLLHYAEDKGQWTTHQIQGDAHNWVYHICREADAMVVTTFNGVYRIKYDIPTDRITEVHRIDATPVLDDRYATTHIGDAEWSITPNGLSIKDNEDVRQIELPEKFVSINYDADANRIYLGGSDVFAIINPQSFARQQNSGIWFDADARFVDEDAGAPYSRGLMAGMVCLGLAIVVMMVLYIRQRQRMHTERARRKAMLKSARQKMARLESDNTHLQQQLQMQMLQTQPTDADANVLPNDFMQQVNHLIDENIDNPQLSVAMLSEKMGLSSKQLYRKVKQCTDLTAVEYIRKLRLQRAAMLLRRPEFTINEIMYMVGFSNPSYFSRTFASEYGMPPSEYRHG